MSHIDAPGFEGWYFYEGFLCTPEGERFTSLAIKACHFVRQTKEVRDLLYWRPDDLRSDVHLRAVQPSSVSEPARASIHDGDGYGEGRRIADVCQCRSRHATHATAPLPEHRAESIYSHADK